MPQLSAAGIDALIAHMSLLVVYNRPRDFPRHVVVREQVAERDGTIKIAYTACLYDTLEEAMWDCDLAGLTFLARHPDDDATIVGVWI
jgi:hypothetical protein